MRGFSTPLRAMGLRLMIHVAAMWYDPLAYLAAAKWRILGKRVRARGQFAAIKARTRFAYDWWVLSKASERIPSEAGTPEIVALISVGDDADQIERTLASLKAEGISAHMIKRHSQKEDLDRVIRNTPDGATSWCLPLQAGDTVAPGTARAYRKAIASQPARIFYADDDALNKHGRRQSPHFKPDWNPELFEHHDYLTGACVMRVDPVAVQSVSERTDWARALVEEALGTGGPVIHVREMLHHRSKRPVPRRPQKTESRGRDMPSVSVLIPTRNRVDLLSTCVTGLQNTCYPAIEIIVIDNDSDDPATLEFLETIEKEGGRVLRHPGAFNYSQINNRAVQVARGDFICLLNNDIETLEPGWLSIMVSQAVREEVGAVGAQLLYPDGRLQHAGVVTGVGNAAGHAHRLLRPEDEGYFCRHALPQFITAVTAACLVVKREKFLAVGGLDESNFKVAFNDVDLCLKLNKRGWQSFYEPRAVLVHHESVSRGFDKDKAGAARFARELAALQTRWRTDELTDPYHHPALSRATEQFSFGLGNV